jgi:hypothetical protein
LEPIYKEKGKKQREDPEKEIGAINDMVDCGNDIIESGLVEAME